MTTQTLRRPRGDLTLTGFVAAGLVVLALLAATAWLSVQQRRAAAWVNETHEVLRAIAITRGALIDIQNGHRGFTIEGTEEALQPYYQGIAAVQQETARLRFLLQDTEVQQGNLAELQRVLPARLASAAQLVQARRSGGMTAVRQILETGWPAEQMGALRGLLRVMEREQEQLLEQRLANQEHSLRWFWDAVIAIAVLLAGALSVLYLQVRRRRSDQCRLLESEERFHLMTSSVVDYAIVMLDPEGRVRSWNAGAERILGYSAEEVAADHHFSRFYAEADLREQQPVEDMRAATLRGHCAREGWRVRRDGSVFWASSVLSAFRNPDGTLRGFCLVLRDLTERQRSTEALRAEMAERARIARELEQLNRSLEGVVGERTRELQQANGELSEAKQRLQELSARLIHAQEQERRHVARELHDDTGQALTAIRMNLMEVLRGGDAGARMQDSVAIVDRAIAHIRGMALRLRPTMLDDLGLVDALEWALDEQARASGWRTGFDAGDCCPVLPPEVETACFRIVQESLTNAARHAQASHVKVRLRVLGERLELRIEDDGVGFDPQRYRSPQERTKHFGLVSMTERAHLVGGTLDVDAAPGRGTCIRVLVPIPVPDAAEPDAALLDAVRGLGPA